jgi:hypothetical protein
MCSGYPEKMTVRLETWTKTEVRSVISFPHSKSKTPTQIHQKIIAMYAEYE